MSEEKKVFDNNKRYKIGVIIEKKYSTKNPEFNDQYPAFVYTGEQLKKKYKCKNFVEYLERNPDNLPSKQIFSCYEVVDNPTNKAKPSFEFFDMGQPLEKIQSQIIQESINQNLPSSSPQIVPVLSGLANANKDDNEILDMFKNQTNKYQDFTQSQLNDVKATYQAQLEQERAEKNRQIELEREDKARQLQLITEERNRQVELERLDKERQIQLMKEQLEKVIEIKDHAIQQQREVAESTIAQLKSQIEDYKLQLESMNNAKSLNNDQYDKMVMQLQKEKQELWGIVNEREQSVRDFYSKIISSKEIEIDKLANTLENERQEHIEEISRLQEELHQTKAELNAERKINTKTFEMTEDYQSKLSGLEEEKQDTKAEMLGSLIELGKMLLPSLVQLGTTFVQSKQQQTQMQQQQMQGYNPMMQQAPMNSYMQPQQAMQYNQQPMQLQTPQPAVQAQPVQATSPTYLSDGDVFNIEQLEVSDNYKKLLKHLMLNFKLNFEDSQDYLDKAISAMQTANSEIPIESIENHLIESWINKANETETIKENENE